jgi:uncharacterized protein (TIGR00661 family)
MKNRTGRKRLAFSCAGEGFGHIARIVALSEYLKKEYDIIYFIPDTVKGFLKQHLGEVTTIVIPSFHFVLENHSIDYMKTAAGNIPYIFQFGRIVSVIRSQLSDCRIDAVICDFEPFVSRAALSLGIPLMNFSHPGILIKTLPFTPSGIVSRLVARFMTPGAQVTAFCSFYNGEAGPVIRNEIRMQKPTAGNYFLVYTKQDSRRKMVKSLKKFPEYRFEVYPGSGGNFAGTLAGCRGVIAPAGHQLISEALYLGKPVLAFPQKGQYEQTVNARMLQKSGRGMYGRLRYAEHDMKKFFTLIDEFPFPQDPFERFCFTDDTPHVIDLIRRFVFENTVLWKGLPVHTYTYIDAFLEKITLIQERLNSDRPSA